MTNKSSSVSDDIRPGETISRRRMSIQSTNSPRINGKISFRINGLTQFNETMRCGTYALGKVVYSAQGVNWIGFNRLPTAIDLSCRVTASSRFYSRLSSVNTNLAEAFATRRQTANMVLSTINRLTTSYMQLRRRNWRAAARTLGIDYKKPSGKNPTPAGVWLEYQYGWKPLIQDVYNIVNRTFPEPKMKVKGSYSSTIVLIDNFSSGASTAIGVSTFKTRHYVGASVRVTNAGLQAASSYGIQNPALLAWELLPYSFVVDWFIPIGGYLESMQAINGLSLSDGYRGSCVSHNQIDSLFLAFADQGTGHCARFWDRTDKEREVGLPPHALPRFKSPFSPTHVANALSLMAEAFRHK